MGDYRKNGFTVNIELIIDGESVDPNKFFSRYSDWYEECVEKAARRIIEEQLSDKISNINTVLDNCSNTISNMVDDINLKIENPLLKTNINDDL